MRKIEKIMQIQQKNRCFQAVLLLKCGRRQKGSNPRHAVLEWLFNGEKPFNNRFFKPFVVDFL